MKRLRIKCTETHTDSRRSRENTGQYVAYVKCFHTWFSKWNDTYSIQLTSWSSLKHQPSSQKDSVKRLKACQHQEFSYFKHSDLMVRLTSLYLRFLCNIKYKLELLRHSQVFLWRFLKKKRKKIIYWSPMDTFPSQNNKKASYHGFRDLRHNAPLDPPTSEKQNLHFYEDKTLPTNHHWTTSILEVFKTSTLIVKTPAFKGLWCTAWTVKSDSEPLYYHHVLVFCINNYNTNVNVLKSCPS